MAYQQLAGSAFSAATQTSTFSGGRYPQAGNLLIATAWSNSATAMALGTSTGWTLIANVIDSTRQMSVWYKQSDGSELTTTLTGGGTLWLVVYEYAGFQAVFDGSAATSTSAGASVSSLATGALTTTQTDSLVFACWATFGAAGTAPLATAGTFRNTSIPGVSNLDYYPNAALSGFTDTFSWSTTTNIALSVAVAFKAKTNNGFFGLMGG